MRKVELLPTRDCEAGYGPGDSSQKERYTFNTFNELTQIKNQPKMSFRKATCKTREESTLKH